MLFLNHGIMPSELYTRSPKHIYKHGKNWYRDRMTYRPRSADYYCAPLEVALSIIFHKMIDEKKRFKIPQHQKCYFDFETIAPEQFKKIRQKGGFKEIDYIATGFYNYTMMFTLNYSERPKKIPIYLGGDLKRKFLSYVNNGIKFNVVSEFELNDIIDEVVTYFPRFDKKHVKDLIVYGFSILVKAIKSGCYFTLSKNVPFNAYAFIGWIFLDQSKNIKNYHFRRCRRLRFIHKLSAKEMDDYYYFIISERNIKKWAELNKTSRFIAKFENVFFKKLQEETYYFSYKKSHLFRITLPSIKKYGIWAEELQGRSTTYMGVIEKYKFTPSNLKWIQLRNTYVEKCN